MPTQLRETRYKGHTAYALESGACTVLVVPELGGKIASIRLLPEARELLVPFDGDMVPACVPGDRFEDGACAGWDEMFPNIGAGPYGAPPFADLRLPCHGEVWQRAWRAEADGTALHLAIDGVCLPYTLAKRVTLEGSTLRQAYQLTNHGEAAWDYLWAAHPLFQGAEGVRIVLPEGVDTVRNAAPGPRLPVYGARYAWPTASTPDGAFRLDRIPARNGTCYQKYYVDGALSAGWVALVYPDGLRITLRFPLETVPCVGMWVNEGGWCGQYCIAPEPATGTMDTVEAAREANACSRIAPGATIHWWLETDIARGTA